MEEDFRKLSVCLRNPKHLVSRLVDKKTNRIVDRCQECHEEIWHTPDVSDYEVDEEVEKPKEKNVRKDIPLLFTLPGTHPPKRGDGQYFRYNMGHVSREDGWHVERASVQNCKRWECERDWNKEPDEENNSAGPLYIESSNIKDQISEFQNKVLSIFQIVDMLTGLKEALKFFFKDFEWTADTIKKQVGDKKAKIIIVKEPETTEDYWLLMRALHGDSEIHVEPNLTTETIKYFADSGNLITLTRTMRKMHGSLVPNSWTPEMRRNLSLVLIGQFKKKNHWKRKFNVYHYVISFDPSTHYESIFDYKALSHKAQSLAQEAGIFGGVMAFHPFRVPGEFNDRTEIANGPHFHIIGFGHLMQGKTEEIYTRDNVTIKVMHYDRDNGHVGVVKSVFDTAEYILSHHGRAWDRTRILDDLERYNEWVRLHNHAIMVTFILPRPKSNLSEELMKDLGIPEPNSSSKDADHFDSVDIDQVAKDSLSWHKFLRSPFGHFVIFHIDNLKSFGHFPLISKSNISENGRLHPIETIHWFGILGNSKKHLVGIKREKKVYYCPKCKSDIPQSDMHYVKIRKPSSNVLGPTGPPDDPLLGDIGFSDANEEWIPSTDIWKYFPEFMINDHGTGIYLVPDRYVRPIDNNVKRYLFV